MAASDCFLYIILTNDGMPSRMCDGKGRKTMHAQHLAHEEDGWDCFHQSSSVYNNSDNMHMII